MECRKGFDPIGLILGYGHSQLAPFQHNNQANYTGISSLVSCNNNGNGRRKRSWSRAVFSNLQRKGLEKRFQIQKYITKPDRRQLAATLGLTDAQVRFVNLKLTCLSSLVAKNCFEITLFRLLSHWNRKGVYNFFIMC